MRVLPATEPAKKVAKKKGPYSELSVAVVAAVAVAQRLMRFMKKERPLLRQRRPAAYGMCGVWVFYPKLYMTSTINTYLMLWHMKLPCIPTKF